METIHLNLKKKWFDMILSGGKKEEYREVTSYWKKRLQKMCSNCDGWCNDGSCKCGGYYDQKLSKWVFGYEFKNFDSITFSNGYHKNRRQFVIDLGGIHIGTGLNKWGAEKGKRYFVLKLGQILNK